MNEEKYDDNVDSFRTDILTSEGIVYA